MSLFLHGALLWVQMRASPVGGEAPLPSGPLQVRMIAAAGSTGSTRVEAAAEREYGTSAIRPDPDILPGGEPSGRAAPPPAMAIPLVSDAPLDDAVPEDASAGYLPRHALTRAPRPLSDPVVSVAPGLGDAGEQRGIFSLFINASGFVDSVVRDGPTLSAALEEAAVEVLKATRFSPGERDGVAVAAVLRIEIMFENQAPAHPQAAVIVSQQPL